MPIRRQWFPAIVFVAGLLITIFAAWTVNGFILRAESSDVPLVADRATAAVRLALDRAALATRAVRAMYASDVVTSEQFGRFAQTLATDQSAGAVGFVRRVEAVDRAAYESGLTGDPASMLGIWENDTDNRPIRALDRPVHFVLESALLPGGTRPRIGFDVASLIDRADVIRRALDRFQLAITGEVALAQLGGTGIVLFDPVVDRASRLIGVATASVTRDDLFRVAAQTSGVTDFTLAVGAAGSAPAAAAGGAAATIPPAPGPASSGDATSRSFAFADRLITIAVNGLPRVGARPWINLLVVALGLAATAAAIASLFNQTKREELRVAERRLRTMLDGLGPIAFLLAGDGKVISANRAAVTTFGHSEDEMVRQPFAGLVAANAEADKRRLEDAIAAATRGEDVRFDLKLEGAEGRQVFDLWIRRNEMSNDLVASAVDVTDRYEAEETQRLLMRELDHRMKNTLQVIQAIIRRTATSQESIAKFEQALLGRVGAMSRAHDLLASERWHGADITAVIRQETEHLAGGRSIVAEGPPFRLSPKAALSLALVIHELATNAVKYGALSAADGKVEIRWEVDRAAKEPRLVLRWQESQGPRVVPARHRGFGSMLIERSIAYELDGSAEVNYREQGLVCTIAAPLRTVRSFAQPHQSMLAAR